jgi:hypothetical protein
MKVYPAVLKAAEAVRRYAKVRPAIYPFTDAPDNRLWLKNGRFCAPARSLSACSTKAFFRIVLTFF